MCDQEREDREIQAAEEDEQRRVQQQVQADLEVGLDLKLELERSAEDLAGGAGGDGAFGACGGGGDPEEEGYGYTIDDYDADDESVMELRCIQVSTNQT